MDNLQLMEKYGSPGAVVECGVWRGGMIAAAAKRIGDQCSYHLFDSFEGVPDAKEIDGESAQAWMQDNIVECCATEEEYAHEAMSKAGVASIEVVKGWFSETLPKAVFPDKISILRLDADWYSSTAECLNFLYDRVKVGGVIILDDYFAWDGCSRALHDFLSLNKLADRIETVSRSLAFVEKREELKIKTLNPNPDDE